MLTLNIKVSWLEIALILVCHLTAMAGSFIVAVPLWLKLSMILAIACSLLSHTRHACGYSANSLQQLTIGQQYSRLSYNGYSLQASLPTPVYVSACLMVLQFRAPLSAAESWPAGYWRNQSGTVRLILFTDSLSAAQCRHLCIFLRFGVFPESC